MSIPVQRAESFYLPPAPLPRTAWDLVPPAERAFRWVEHRAQRRLAMPAGVLVGQRTYARINHNRWVVDCPCGSAQIASPADARTACTECGYGWVTVVFPADVPAVEAGLDHLLPHERNWWHDEDPVRLFAQEV